MSIVRGSSPGNFVLNIYEFRLGLPMVDPMVLARSSTVISSLSINVKSCSWNYHENYKCRTWVEHGQNMFCPRSTLVVFMLIP